MTVTESAYLLGSGRTERERLLYQGGLFRPEAERLLDDCGVRRGWRAFDMGCGPLGVLDLLAERVGPDGEAVGLDIDPRMIEMARQTVAERGLTNVRLSRGDGGAANGESPGSFDLAHTRLVLMNVPHPRAVLDQMVSLVRPGGMVAVQDVDWITRICEPAHPAWDRVIQVLAELWRRQGMDVCIGRRLPAMLRRVGLVNVRAHASVRLFGREDPYQTLMIYRAEQCREALLEHGLITGTELDECLAALSAHLDDPETMVMHATLFQAWGEVPAAAS